MNYNVLTLLNGLKGMSRTFEESGLEELSNEEANRQIKLKYFYYDI